MVLPGEIKHSIDINSLQIKLQMQSYSNQVFLFFFFFASNSIKHVCVYTHITFQLRL